MTAGAWSRALDAGPGWEDRLAKRDDGLVNESGRVRIHLAGQASFAEQRRQVDRAARRAYQVLQGINHRGIVQAVQIREHQGGPAILFQHRASDLRLDAYLDAYGRVERGQSGARAVPLAASVCLPAESGVPAERHRLFTIFIER